MEYSLSPYGERFPLPSKGQYKEEYERLCSIADRERKQGREISVIMGLGFVGAVMAAVMADTEDKETGRPKRFVIGMQRPSTRSFWKIPLFNRGVSPISSEDPEVGQLISRCVNQKKTLTATFTYDALRLADVLVVDIQCDFVKEDLGNIQTGHAEMGELEKGFKIIGESIQPHCLVLIETTVPPGTTEYIAYPLIKRAFRKRGIDTEPLLAHSFERVMPGRNYVKSIREFWRVCSGVNRQSREKVVDFLSDIIDVDNYPLTVLDRPIESETCKIVENSYRAAILAFLDEWSLFAESHGVDLIKVIDAIKHRPTHNNIIFPGPGIGGYCLPKDGGLGLWAHKHILGFDGEIFKITRDSVNINDTRALHAARLTRDALRNMGKIVAASYVTILGASYKEDVGDTRYSGSELIVRKLAEMGAEIKVHDPYIAHWWEFEKQDTYPAIGKSRSRFFRNQEHLKEMSMCRTIQEALKEADAVVLTVRHKEYLTLKPDDVVEMAGGPLAVVDCFGILDDEKIEGFFQLGCEVKGMGRGHIRSIKEKTGNRPNRV